MAALAQRPSRRGRCRAVLWLRAALCAAEVPTVMLRAALCAVDTSGPALRDAPRELGSAQHFAAPRASRMDSRP